MKIAIIGNGMPFNQDTLKHEGLGGSETAQLCMGKTLGALGAEVYQFCTYNGPIAGWDGDSNVYYDHWQAAPQVMPDDIDVLIGCRQPGLVSPFRGRSKFTSLWIQDFATDSYPLQTPSIRHHGIEEIWAVSKWQARQWSEKLIARFGHNADHSDLPGFWVTRNGIPKIRLDTPHVTMKFPDRLMFAARPERGLLPLVRPGGIMERLPEYQLMVAGYNDRPAEHAQFYRALDDWMAMRSNVTNLGSLPAKKLRQMIGRSSAYIMPTNYRETSCILARECIEQRTPMIVTPEPMSGALIETVGDCGVIGSSKEWNSEEFCQDFADTTRLLLEGNGPLHEIDWAMKQRRDLYWEGVATDWLFHLKDKGVWICE